MPIRSTALRSTTRKGDLDVYLRAVWAAREGKSLYQITDPHGWHYLYPPLLASLSIPLADPPDDASPESRTGTLPYWVSITIWYWFGIACFLASVHRVASALEDTGAARGSPPPPTHSQGWRTLRVLPLLLRLCFAGDGLGRGQSTPILLLCLAGSGAAMANFLTSVLDGIDEPQALDFGLATFAALALGALGLWTARRRAAAGEPIFTGR